MLLVMSVINPAAAAAAAAELLLEDPFSLLGLVFREDPRCAEEERMADTFRDLAMMPPPTPPGREA